jgi:hypothetical protein
MAEEIHHPHDLMVHAVLSDVTEASSFLQAYLPGEVSQELNWSTLRLVEGSFLIVAPKICLSLRDPYKLRLTRYQASARACRSSAL